MRLGSPLDGYLRGPIDVVVGVVLATRVWARTDGYVRAQMSARACRGFRPRAYTCQKNGSPWVVHRDCSSSGWII